MSISGIYQIQSKRKPGRIYIGSAIRVSHRWNCHLSDLRLNKHHSGKLQNHFNKYGEADLQFSILLGCEKEDLIKTEQYFIDSYNPYFNCCKIAGSPLGVKHSTETRKKASERNKGKHYSKKTEFKKGMTPWNKGKKLAAFSEETKQKMSDSQKGINTWMKGRHHSEETKFKQSKALKGRKMSDESRLKMSLSQKGNKKWLGKNHSGETKQKLRELGKKDWELRRAKKAKQLLLQTILN